MQSSDYENLAILMIRQLMDHFGDRIILFLAIFSPLIDGYRFSSDLFAEVVELAIYFGILLEMYNEASMCRWAESALGIQYGNQMVLSLSPLPIEILEAVGGLANF